MITVDENVLRTLLWIEHRAVTESLAHAHLAGTSRRPDRLQLMGDKDLSSLRLVQFFVVLPLYSVPTPCSFLDKILCFFPEVVAGFVEHLGIALTLRCVTIDEDDRVFVIRLLVEAIERVFSRPGRYFETIRFTGVVNVDWLVADN